MFPEKFFFVFIFAIPIVAIVMGVAHAIVRTVGQQRLMELAQRERIAAIERGVDPSKLPPLPQVGNHYAEYIRASAPYPARRAQGLLIGGIITLAVGIGLSLMTYILEPDSRGWASGIVPMLIGVGLLVSSWVCWPRGKNGAGTC